MRVRAIPQLASTLIARGRGWQSLFDVLNEARAFAYLLSIGCTRVRFLPPTIRRTPDIEGFDGDRRVLCEVKTINVSDAEADARLRIAAGECFVRDTPTHVDSGFLKRLRRSTGSAISQLDAEDPDRRARRLVIVIINFDDGIGDDLPAYFADIDKELERQPIAGVQLLD